jgi:hypothetical protein
MSVNIGSDTVLPMGFVNTEGAAFFFLIVVYRYRFVPLDALSVDG